MHAKEDPRVLRFRDGFWFSRALLRREHAELETLRQGLQPEAREDVLHAFSTVWQIVDTVFRVRELARSMPGLNQGDAHLRAFLAATETAERFRHYIQHLRGELAKREVDRFPVWGALSWVSSSDEWTQFTAVTGAMPAGMEIRTGVFDAQENRWVSRVSLCVKGTSFNVDPIVRETCAFCDHILGVIAELQPALPPLEKVGWFSAHFVVKGGGNG